MSVFEAAAWRCARCSRRVSLLLIVFFAAPASAHVKWFASYSVAATPRTVGRVVDTDFVGLTLLAVALMLVGCVIDRTRLGEAVSRSLDRVLAPVHENSELLVRGACGFFLVAIWSVGGILLTPELKTTSPWIGMLHLVMAGALLWRRTALITAIGMILIYSIGIWQYGLFHLLDYPIFVGVALYLADLSLGLFDRLRIAPESVLRWSTSLTLMWASVEKWAYPQWTLPLYVTHPAMSMGWGFHLFMCAAGVIEFTLAFALLMTPLVQRSAALILLGVFISATFEFGKIDVIGHSVIVAVLLVLAADPRRRQPAPRAWRWIAGPVTEFAAALLGTMTAYYGMHALLFGIGAA